MEREGGRGEEEGSKSPKEQERNKRWGGRDTASSPLYSVGQAYLAVAR